MDVTRSRVILMTVLGCLFWLTACKNERASVGATTFNEISSKCQETAVQNRFLVRWKDGSVSVEHARDRDEFIEHVLAPNENDIEVAEHDQMVRLQEPEMVITTSANPLDDWGQQIIEAQGVWDSGVRGQGVTVAVIDSGVDTEHPQLRNQLAINAAEIENGIDDDGNGLVDDIHGYDFFDNTPDVTDGSGHGTHVSGIIAADHSAGSVKGVAPDAKILPLDFMNANGEGSISAAVVAIKYAVSRGAKVINASWGGGGCSEVLRETVHDLEAKGVLFVVAAGNSGSSLNSQPEYPAAFRDVTQITVAASSTRDFLAGFSNYSYDLVHLAAPGISIVSTIPNGQTAAMSGTSMAAPFVSAAAALLWSARPQASVANIREALLKSVDRDPSDPRGVLPVASGGRLNVRKAIEALTNIVQP